MSILSVLRRRADVPSVAVLMLLAVLCSSCDAVVTEAEAPRSFMKAIGGGLDDDGYALRETRDGGFIIAGRTESFGAGKGDVYLVKTGASGDVLWSRTFGGADDDEARDVLELDGGGYVVVGSTLSFGAGSSDIFALRVNANGDSLWSRTVGTIGPDHGHAVVHAIGGGFLIGGRSNSAGSGFDHYLVRLSESGDSLWARPIAGSLNEQTNALLRLDDGYLLGGSIDKSYHIVRVDTSGRILAERRDVSFEAQVNGFVPIDGQSCIAVGRQKKGTETDNVMVMTVSTTSRTSIPNPAATLHTYGRAGGNVGYSGVRGADGQLVVFGSSRGFGRLDDLYLLKTDASSGALIWSQSYGGDYDDVGRALVATRDGGYAILGTASSFVDSFNGRDLILMKVDANGELRE